MTTIDNLASRFHAAVSRGQFAGWVKMYTGRRTDTGITLAGAATGKTWVRAEETSREETQVWGNATRANLPVWVGPNIAGELEIKTLEQTEATLTAGAGAAGSLLPPILPENNAAILISGRQFQPGRLRLSDLGGLYVYAEPFQYDGGYWPGGNLALTPPSTASTQAWVAVALDPADDTLNEYAGAEYALPVVLTDNELAQVVIPAACIPLGGVVLQNGQTTITGAETWGDLRYHFGQVGSRVRAASAQTTNSTTATIASEAVAEGEAITLTATITGAIADYSAAIGGTVTITARRASAGNVTLVGSVVTNVQEDSGSSPTFTADVDTTTQTVRLRVTGVASETWNWRVTYDVLRENA